MSRSPRRRRARLRLGISVLPVVLGLLDGITNALGLAAHAILAGGSGVGLGLALRVASFALVTAVFAICRQVRGPADGPDPGQRATEPS